MPLFPERERRLDVKFQPEDVSPLDIEKKEVVSPVPSQFTKQVKSDNGQVLTQSPQTAAVTITLPSDKAQLTTLAKGSVSDSATWWASFWLRIIKKALHFGWKILGKNQ